MKKIFCTLLLGIFSMSFSFGQMDTLVFKKGQKIAVHVDSVGIKNIFCRLPGSKAEYAANESIIEYVKYKDGVIYTVNQANFQKEKRDSLSKNICVSVTGGIGIPTNNNSITQVSLLFPGSNNYALNGYNIAINAEKYIGVPYLVICGTAKYSSNPFDVSSFGEDVIESQNNNYTDEFVRMVTENYQKGYYRILSLLVGAEGIVPINRFELFVGASFGMAFDFSPAVSYNATYITSRFNQYIGQTYYSTSIESINAASQSSQSFTFDISLGLKYNVCHKLYIMVNPAITFNRINATMIEKATAGNYYKYLGYPKANLILMELNGGIGYCF